MFTSSCQHCIGDKTTGTRGLLLIIDPHQQQDRIKVGYDLEGIPTDGFIARLQYEQLLPFSNMIELAMKLKL
jgi:uncharacterized membrane protein YgcG